MKKLNGRNVCSESNECESTPREGSNNVMVLMQVEHINAMMSITDARNKENHGKGMPQ